jgi:hypothetical protein
MYAFRHAARWIPLAALLLAGCAAVPQDRTVVNPHVSTGRSVDCSTVDRILADLIHERMTDEEKVLAVFHWVRRVLYHGDGYRRRAYDFHFLVNVTGNGSCARQTTPMALLLGRLGFRSRSWTHNGHHMMEVLYGGKWHCFDPHMTFYVYDRSNPPTIASIEQLRADPTLAEKAVEEGRACPGFLLCGDSPKVFTGGGRWKCYGEWPDGFHKVTLDEPFGRITLRRGERYVRTWMPGEHWFKANSWMKDSGPYHTCRGRDRQDTVNWPLYEPHAWRLGRGSVYRHWGSGRLIYTPDLSGGYRDAVVAERNLGPGTHRRMAALMPVDPAEPGEVVFSVRCPYVLTAGRLTLLCAGEGAVTASVSTNGGRTWQAVELRPYGGLLQAEFVEPVNGALDGYWLRLRSTGGTGLAGLKLVSEFELNPYSLPHLVPGRNGVKVEAGSYGSPLTVRYEWAEGEGWTQERSAERTFTGDGAFVVDVAGPKYPRMKALELSVAP